jgi:hypothetical protein
MAATTRARTGTSRFLLRARRVKPRDPSSKPSRNPTTSISALPYPPQTHNKLANLLPQATPSPESSKPSNQPSRPRKPPRPTHPNPAQPKSPLAASQSPRPPLLPRLLLSRSRAQRRRRSSIRSWVRARRLWAIWRESQERRYVMIHWIRFMDLRKAREPRKMG